MNEYPHHYMSGIVTCTWTEFAATVDGPKTRKLTSGLT